MMGAGRWIMLGVGSLTLSLVGGCGHVARPAEPVVDLQAARRAFIAHDLERAERLYALVAEADTLPAEDRAAAFRRMAALAWRVRQEPAEGRSLLARALALGVDSSATFAELARLATEAGTATGAMGAAAAAEAALRTARTEADRERAVSRLGAAVVVPAREALLEKGDWPDAAGRQRVREVLVRLRALNEGTPGLLEPSRLQLMAALLVDDGPAALAGWRSYYLLHLDRGGPLPAAAETLGRVLPAWAGPAAPASARTAAIRALAASGMYDAALVLALDPRVTGPAGPGVGHADANVRAAGGMRPPDPDDEAAVADVVAYGRFLRRITSITEAYYRATAVGAGDPDAYRDALVAEAAGLWERLHWPGGAPPFEVDAFEPEVGRRFGADIRLGTTAGYFDLHYGHRVVEEPRVVEQYGQRAELRFVALDGMVSNGFQSWAWDGEQAHGGWADEHTIVQVRPGYAAGPLRVWRSFTDPVESARRQREATADSVRDLDRARQDPYAYLPGLRARLLAQGVLALRDSLAAAGLTGDALRAAFLAAYDHAHVESSIFAHEGRHAIDRRLGLELPPWEREYRAKLSEVAFAPLPRLALRGGILNPNIGDDTPHGRANLRIMKELVAWMDAHRGEIAGLDPALPLLPQLSLLTDDQLRRAFRSFDPMAREVHP